MILNITHGLNYFVDMTFNSIADKLTVNSLS